jgi:AbrB family looped-hinge helix DNA binding protein
MGHLLTTKGQVTIPKAVRDHLGLTPGSEVEFVVDGDGHVRVRRAQAASDSFAARLERWRGRGIKPDWQGLTTDEIMELLRGPRD